MFHFSTLLQEKIIQYFAKRGIKISPDQAQDYLSSLADLCEVVGVRSGGRTERGAAGARPAAAVILDIKDT